MINRFLTITEALVFLNNKKSYSSLNRLVHKLKNNKNTKHYIKIIKGKNLISEDYLVNHFPEMINHSINQDSEKINQVNTSGNIREITDLLKEQLKVKDEQINNLTKQVNDYSERLKESHYTNQVLTNKIALLESNQSPLTTDNKNDEDFNQWQKLLYKLGLIQKK